MCLWFVLAVALAAEPVVTRGEDSWVEAYVDVEASPDAVFSVISSPEAVARIDGDSTTARASPDGSCLAVDTHVDHPIASVSYQTRACPDGKWAVRQVLVGGDMKAFECRWWVEEREEGARLHYKLRSIPRLFVPQFLVNQSTVKSVGRTLGKLRDHLETSGGGVRGETSRP